MTQDAPWLGVTPDPPRQSPIHGDGITLDTSPPLQVVLETEGAHWTDDHIRAILGLLAEKIEHLRQDEFLPDLQDQVLHIEIRSGAWPTKSP